VSNRKLLIADDSVTIQKVIKLTFTEEGYEVFTAPDGESAMSLLRAERPDIVLADVNMPGPDGYEICRAIRSDVSGHFTPVVLLAGSFEPFDEQMASAVGASASVTKPFQSIRQLVHQVNELVNSRDSMEREGSVESIRGDDPNHSDIESLYHRSIHEIPANAETVEFEFSDQGLDDEMIETQYSSTAFETEMPMAGQLYDEHTVPPETPLTEQPIANVERSGSSESSWTNGDTEAVADVPAFNYEHRTDRDAVTYEMTTGNYAPHPKRDDLIDNEAETERLVPVSDGFEFEPVVPQSEKWSPLGLDDSSTEKNAEHLGAGSQFETGELPSISDSNWNDIDLLEIPEVVHPPNPVRFTTEREALNAESNERVVALSDELIDLIATRVAEKLNRTA